MISYHETHRIKGTSSAQMMLSSISGISSILMRYNILSGSLIKGIPPPGGLRSMVSSLIVSDRSVTQRERSQLWRKTYARILDFVALNKPFLPLLVLGIVTVKSFENQDPQLSFAK